MAEKGKGIQQLYSYLLCLSLTSLKKRRLNFHLRHSTGSRVLDSLLDPMHRIYWFHHGTLFVYWYFPILKSLMSTADSPSIRRDYE